MPKPSAIITDFVLSRLEGETVKKRIKILTALSALTPSKTDRAEIQANVAGLRAIETRHRQLVLDFKRRAEG